MIEKGYQRDIESRLLSVGYINTLLKPWFSTLGNYTEVSSFQGVQIVYTVSVGYINTLLKSWFSTLGDYTEVSSFQGVQIVYTEVSSF